MIRPAGKTKALRPVLRVAGSASPYLRVKCTLAQSEAISKRGGLHLPL
jgi:hypothetical protein